MKKVLFVATVDGHIKSFHTPYLKMFYESGYEVHVASNGDSEFSYVHEKHNILFKRSPFHIHNIFAYIKLKKIIKQNAYSIVHCHTPVGGVLTRLCSKEVRRKSGKVFYTAHGFHFYKGAPWRYWFFYYTIEKLLSKSTDCLITINKEDFEIAQNNFRCSRVEYVPGIGVDLEKFKPVDNYHRQLLRKKHGYSTEDYILFFAGELSKRKNQSMLLLMIKKLKLLNLDVKLLLAGEGKQQKLLQTKIKKLGLEENARLLGFRTDIKELIGLSDIIVSSSRQEGLPINIVEALAIGRPIIATNVRGNRDLIKEGFNGFLTPLNNYEYMSELVIKMFADKKMTTVFSENATLSVCNYSLQEVMSKMRKIYEI
ncbi:glycosyltransferase family 4 protein [Cohnella sp. GCM10020058]|uniref:glycosyltransferase family 4 protein n=1 Tax=Cohnella sp. GCM10020058 TaxID=3317330 RepID=UPI0036406C3C